MTVERLRGFDAAFLYMETPSQHMHVTATMLFEPRAWSLPNGEPPDPEMVAAAIAERVWQRLVEQEAFRRRLVEEPLAIAHPAWVDVASVDLREHLHLLTLPPPGSLTELAATVARIAEEPVDRTRPLWELWAIAGIEGGRVGIVLKVHHAILDGMSGVEVLGRLFADAPRARPAGAADGAAPDPGPSAVTLAVSAIWSALATPAKVARTLLRTARAVAPVVRTSLSNAAAEISPVLPFSSPRTMLNRALTPERLVAFGSVPLAAVKEVKAAFSVTVNDVLLAACTRALGDYLRAHGDDPHEPLVASVPVSEHGTEGPEGLNNRVSVMFVGLPVQLTSVADVLAFVHAQSTGAKRVHGSFGTAMLADWAELAPPALFARAAALYSRWELAERLPPPHSVVISSVPGPPFPLYLDDTRLVAAYPVGPVLEGAGINISIISYAGSVDVGLITCPRAVAAPEEIARGFERAVAEMQQAAARREESGGPPPPSQWH